MSVKARAVQHALQATRRKRSQFFRRSRFRKDLPADCGGLLVANTLADETAHELHERRGPVRERPRVDGCFPITPFTGLARERFEDFDDALLARWTFLRTHGAQILIWNAVSIAFAFLLASATVSLTQTEPVRDMYQEWLEEDVRYIITARERDFFLSLETRDERARFITAFWTKRDPNRTTPENELKDEHYRRIDYANEFLGRESFLPGWRTDRGRF